MSHSLGDGEPLRLAIRRIGPEPPDPAAERIGPPLELSGSPEPIPVRDASCNGGAPGEPAPVGSSR